MKNHLVAVAIASVCAMQTWAVPTLQLDIAGGTYDNSTESIVTSANPFTLQALISGGIRPNTSYYIFAAIIAADGSDAADFGSFSIDGTVFSEGSLNFGTPPVDSMSFGPDDIGKHDVFPTYYAEISFTPSATKLATEYNSQDTPGGLVANAAGTLVYEDFLVDITSLTEGYKLHFDFYSVSDVIRGPKKSPVTGDEISGFAPFSHDAQSPASIPPTTPPPTGVPDGGSTALLLGAGMIGLTWLGRRARK